MKWCGILLFFEDVELSKVKRVRLAELPRTPDTGWRPPRDYPNISQVRAVGFDFEVEEKDFEHGPGWARGKASICGGALDLLYPDGSVYTEYRPIRHTVDAHLNLPVENTIRFWKAVLENKDTPKFGANLIYDIGNATDEGIWVQGDLYDCQYAEALLTQDDPVALEFISQKYLNEGKDTSQLYEWCAKAYGGEPTSKQRSNIYRTSPILAGPYGEKDGSLPRRVLTKQYPELQRQGLWDLFRMECELIPLWVLMRKFGCRVDIDQAERMKLRLTKEIVRTEKALFDLTGKHFNVNARTELAPVYDAMHIKYPLTETGEPSFRADWFMDQSDSLSELILETRQYYKLRDTFVDSYILKSHINGIIHGQFHPLRNEGSRGESGGTVTGRLSSSTPNLQNIPSRTILGKEIMKMFLPHAGHLAFESGDYSQIEYRMFMHYAIGPKSDEFRQKYVDDPDTDYHNVAQAAVKAETGIYIPRNAKEVAAGNFKTGRLTIKEPNFGVLFFLGAPKMSRMAHCELSEGKKIVEALKKALPFIVPSQKAFIAEAKQFGYITTILGGRYRFDLWEAISEWDAETESYTRTVGLPYHQALKAYGRIQRAGTHKSIAGRCQGSAAHVLKKALHMCLRNGVFDVIGYPLESVHDQVGSSIIDDSKEQVEARNYYHWVMENAIRLRVPIRFEVERGPNWGSVE